MTRLVHYRRGETILIVGQDSYSVATIGDQEDEGYLGSPDLKGATEITPEDAASALGWPLESVYYD